MNSPLRDESENPDRDGTEKLDSAEIDVAPPEGADAPATADDSGTLDGEAGPGTGTTADAEPGPSTPPPPPPPPPEDSPDLGLIQGEGQAAAASGVGPGRSVRPVEFAQIEPASNGETGGSIEILMDIKLPISVELGRTETFVRDILDFGTGSIIELDKMAGDPVDILVNGRLVAKGEVVVVDDHFGVRITLLLTPEERVRSLG